jgi:hypothetical protein
MTADPHYIYPAFVIRFTHHAADLGGAYVQPENQVFRHFPLLVPDVVIKPRVRLNPAGQ